jgi:hypothetical protein
MGICWLLYNVLLDDNHHNTLRWISTNITNIYLASIRFETL